MPLNIAFRRYDNGGIIMAAAINMIVIGLWHGANWTYAFFGLYYGILYIPLILNGSFAKTRKLKTGPNGLPKFVDFGKMVSTFLLVALGLIIFRAQSMSDCWQYLSLMLTLHNGVHIGLLGSMIFSNIWVYVLVLVILILEWTTKDKEHPLQFSTNGLFRNKIIRWSLYFLLCILLFFLTNPGADQDFIYFQF